MYVLAAAAAAGSTAGAETAGTAITGGRMAMVMVVVVSVGLSVVVSVMGGVMMRHPGRVGAAADWYWY